MVSRRDAPGRASHTKSSSYCDSVHTLMLLTPESRTTALEDVEMADATPRRRQQQQQQSNPGSPSRPRTKPSPLKILVRAFNACRGRSSGPRRSKDSPSPISSPRAASPIPTMSVHEAAAIRRILAVPSRHSLTFASNSSSTASLGVTSRPSTSPSVSSRGSSSTYYTAASFVESPYPSIGRSGTTQAHHPYALAAPVYE